MRQNQLLTRPVRQDLKRWPAREVERKGASNNKRAHANAHAQMRKETRAMIRTHRSRKRNKLAQKVLERPSTAILAPCASASAKLLAIMAAFAATSSTPASEPRWLKQYCPARPSFNWPGICEHMRKIIMHFGMSNA